MPALRTRDTQTRTLEVTTDAPQPPTLAIISPTPRAFTFPISHNLSDSPYSSPSHSPFEPDLRSLTLPSYSTPPPFTRTLSPESATSSPSSASSAPQQHKRRKSSSTASCISESSERRPKKGDDNYIKRPENAFILFRRKCCEDRHAAMEEADGPTKKQRQADLSKAISQQWKALPAEERSYWEQLAKEKKKEHEQMYPNYVYRPQRSKDKDGRSKSRKPKARRGEMELQEEEESVSFVLPVHHRPHGRSASAPTPPPYQSIQIPNVYQMTPSCPTSPSLMPMISRRSGHPGHPDEAPSSYEYVQNDTFMPPAYGQAGQFEASLQSSEFLRNMFNLPGQQQQDTLMQPLAIPHEPTLHFPHHHHLVSPGSSGPNSPHSSPYTPTSAVLAHSFSHLSASEQHHLVPQPQSQAEIDLHMEMQLQQYGYEWENNSLWPSGSEMLMGNDFDINSIPPIELGVPKFNGEDAAAAAAGAAEYTQIDGTQHLEGLLGFDEMMAGHGF